MKAASSAAGVSGRLSAAATPSDLIEDMPADGAAGRPSVCPGGCAVGAVVVVGAAGGVGEVAGDDLDGDLQALPELLVRLVDQADVLALLVPPARELAGREAAGADVLAPPAGVGGA